MKNLIANEAIKKVVGCMKENEDMFDMMDLKLHDVQSYRWKEMEKDFPLCYKEDEDCKIGYDTIKDFKENQVKYYKEYLENEEERLQFEIDKELEEENTRKNTVNHIKDKYNISDEDMEEIKNNLF